MRISSLPRSIFGLVKRLIFWGILVSVGRQGLGHLNRKQIESYYSVVKVKLAPLTAGGVDKLKKTIDRGLAGLK